MAKDWPSSRRRPQRPTWNETREGAINIQEPKVSRNSRAFVFRRRRGREPSVGYFKVCLWVCLGLCQSVSGSICDFSLCLSG